MNDSARSLLPCTRISPMTRIRVERILPAPGEILVRTGQQVGALQKIARIPVRGEIRVVNVAHTLSLEDPNLSQVMVKKRGDQVEAGEILAARRGSLPFWHKPCRSPIAGRLAAIGHDWVVIEAESEAMDLLAFVAGQVTAIAEGRSVTIEAIGAHIVGACGVGGEGVGVLQVAVKDPSHTLTADDIGLGFNNAILVGGAGVTPEALERAEEMKVRGIILGSINASLHDLISAPPFPIVATEGYGKLSMSSTVFDILKRLEGHEASISGQMGEAWDSVRPAIVVPLTERQEDGTEFPTGELPVEPARVGDRVRVVRSPLLGQEGEIVSLLAKPQFVPSGLSLAGAQVAFARAEHLSSQPEEVPAWDLDTLHPTDTPHSLGPWKFVPWLNLERIS